MSGFYRLHVTKFSSVLPVFYQCLRLPKNKYSFTLFSSIRIVLDCFNLLIFYFEEFSTWIWCLPFSINVTLILSNMQNYNKLSQSQFDYSIQTIKYYPRLIVLFLYGTFLEVRHFHLHLLEPRGWVLYPSHLLPLQFYDLLSNEQQEKKFSTAHSLFRRISHRRYF